MKIIDFTRKYIYYVISILLAIGATCIGLLFLHFGTMHKSAPIRTTEALTSGSVLHTPTIDIPITIANNDASREQGLSDTISLPAGSGMLFVFDTASKYGFWMKDMKYDLDLVWIDADLKIVDITADVAADSYPKIFYPSQPVRYVLEVNKKFSTAHGLKIGQIVSISQK